jgi:lysophospholipase L1-like esterase
MGDSFTQGPASDTIAAYREALFVLLRQERSAFKFVGSQASGFTMASFGTSDRTILGDWHHEGHTGQTIANMASYTAAMAASDIILLIIGTNDALAGQTGAQMLTSMAALLVTMAANVSDSCVVLVSKISYLYAPVASPSTKNTHIDTYNAGLAALAAEHGPNFRVVEVASELDAGSEFSSDGIHYNAAGAVKIATLWNTEIQRVVLARGLGCPRRLVLRPGGSSVDLAQGATDKIVIPYGTGLKPPGAGSFTAAIWFRPHVGLITGDHVLMQYGTAHADGYLVAQNGRTIKVYLKGVLLHTSFACLASEKWHRIVAVCDATNLELRLYVTREGVESDPTRGHLVYTGAISAWDVSVNEATTIGFTAATAGVSGLVDGFVFCAGAAADIGDVEADYYDGQALPGATASYLLAEGSSTSVDDATALGGPTGTITTSATSTYVWSPQPSSRIPRYRKPFDEPDAVVQSVIEALQEASAWSLCLLSYQGVQLIRGEWSATGQAAEVETWLDGSDFRNHFTSYGATPVLFDPTAFGGAGGLVFDGVSATLGIFGGGARQVDFTDLQIAGGTAFTGFFVFEAHGSATNSANAYANAGILVNDNGQLSFAIRSGNVIIGAKDGGFQSVSAAFRVGKPTVVACRLDGGLLYVQVDDDAESAGVACGALTSIAASPCWIGRSNGVEYFEGVIGAVLLAPTVLTPDQRTHVRTELKERFLRRRVAHLVADKSGNVLVPNSTAVPGTPLAAGYLYASTGDGTWKSDTPTVTTFGP